MSVLDLPGPKVRWNRPRLYPKQMAAIYEPKRISVIEASTKAGKTAGCVAWLAEWATLAKPNTNHWWVAPVYTQAQIAFSRMFRHLRATSRKDGAVKFRATNGPMRIFLPNGSTIWFKSAEKPDTLYGEDVYSAVIDEASRIREESWHAIYTTLTYTNGPIRIIGNVKGKKNWFYRMARRAEAGDDPMMALHRMTAWDAVEAGVLRRSVIEDARATMPEAVFQELYEARASDDEGNPFGYDNIEACCQPMSDDEPYAWGWDLAKRRDWTVGIALDSEGRTCRFHRFQKPWRETIDTILHVVGITPAVVDQTGVGDPIVEELQRRGGENYQGYKYTGPSKQMLMEGLAMALSNRSVSYPEGPTQNELRAFEYTYTKNGVQYSASEGMHDDCVCALAEAVWCMTHRVGGYDLAVLGS